MSSWPSKKFAQIKEDTEILEKGQERDSVMLQDHSKRWDKFFFNG